MQSYTSICSPESKPPSLKPFVNEVVSRRTMLYFRPGTVWGVMDLLLPVNNLVWTRLEDSSCPFFDSHIKLYPYLCWVLFDSSLLSLLHTTYICILLVSIGIFWIFDNMIRTWSEHDPICRVHFCIARSRRMASFAARAAEPWPFGSAAKKTSRGVDTKGRALK